MFRNYLLIAWRNLLKNRLHSTINIMGLSVGLAACLVIIAFVKFELSFDRHFPNAENIYRLALNRVYPDREIKWANIPPPVAPAIAEQLPEIENFTRIMTFNEPLGKDEISMFDHRTIAVDTGFFTLFPPALLHGGIHDFNEQKDIGILTKSSAIRNFGESNPVGKSLVFQSEFGPEKVFEEILIIGVVEDPLPATHFSYDIIVPMKSLRIPEEQLDEWGGFFSFYSYLSLNPQSNPDEVLAKIQSVVDERMGARFDDSYTMAQWNAEGHMYSYFLQRLTNIHLQSHLRQELKANGKAIYVYLFAIIAGFILFIAIINFINLATARATQRTREVGIRKAIGAGRFQLVRQFLLEATMISIISLAIAVPFVQLILPYFVEVTGKPLSMEFLLDMPYLPVLLLFPLVLGLLAGFYPAIYLSAFRPSAVFRKEKGAHRGPKLRHVLVIGQFIIAVILISGTITVFRQMQYFSEKPLGYDHEHVVLLEQGDWLQDKSELFKNEVLSIPGIESVSFASETIGKIEFADSYRPATDEQNLVNVNFIMCGQTYVSDMGFTLLSGRNFLPEEISTGDNPPNKVILNSTAAKAFGWTPAEAVGQAIKHREDGPDITVVGVVNDFNYVSLHQNVGPLILFGSEDWWNQNVAYIRINTNNMPNTIAGIEQAWRKFVPGKIFEYQYLDESLAELYEAERLTGRLFLIFAGLAILVCCLGLFGLMAFVTERRAQEIGVRKVLGARVDQIVMLLSRDFMYLVIISTLLAIPIAWFGINKWLDNFAFRVDNPLWVLLFAGVVATAISWFTVSYYAFRSARANPVNSLRQE